MGKQEISIDFHLVNRLAWPDRSILVVEDDLAQQELLAGRLRVLLGGQSRVVVNFMSNAFDALCYLITVNNLDKKDDFFFIYNVPKSLPKLIILDHDLQWGNGVDFLNAIKNAGIRIPVFTASGCMPNNLRLMEAGATYCYTKDEIIDGKANAKILELLDLDANPSYLGQTFTEIDL